MATAPANNLPIFYNDIVPLSSVDHADFRARPLDNAGFLVNQHAVPLTSDEFVSACRFFPIVFSAGDNPVPLALMGLNEGVNTFVDSDGKLLNPVYVPAYIRRYPFLLARLNPDSEELSLCFDPTSSAIGKFEDGDALFEDGKPTEPVNAILEFCKNFEEAGQRTGFFMEELKKADLLMDGEVAIQPEGSDKPYVYRGFQMVDENKLRELRGDVLRKMMQNGILGLIFAHLFSLQLMREVFAEQVKSGRVPELVQVPTV
ncbi:MAG TPA: SapC family protein [Sphingopyxis sp.]|uniref:SapC family protein n=1 Tax=Sphingopyxis sp. TaxID=1908224 RepID=UPI002E331702|nr:SapC family protein [Sphingopyxis sp.]HEX2811240.1 SapC family protein [Sphingopyxis sp.]